MITGIPEMETLRKAGLGYLCLGWTTLMGLLSTELECKDAQEFDKLKDDPDLIGREDLVAEHWKFEAHQLNLCATLIHQGAEFLLKARIANVSPFLLLKDLEKKANGKDLDFSDIPTINATDLPKVHDTVCPTPLTEDFKNKFNKFRKRRNTVTHGVKEGMKLSAEEMLKDILFVATNLEGTASWPRIRREYAHSTPLGWVDEYGEFAYSLMEEYQRLIKLLGARECKEYLGVPKKQRKYICRSCYRINFPETKLAYFKSSEPGATELYCVVCDSTARVKRIKCLECAGDVIDDERCLSCAAPNS